MVGAARLVLLLARCIWCCGDQPDSDAAQRKRFAMALFGSLPHPDRGSLPSACARVTGQWPFTTGAEQVDSSRAPAERDSGKECYGLLQDFYCDSTGIPDFYFSGNTSAMRHVFMDFSDRVWFTSLPHVQNAKCCCMHDVIAGALTRAELLNGVRLGLYLYRVDSPQGPSMCSEKLHLCT